MKVNVDVPLGRIADLLCTGMEGGIGYWCQIDWDKSSKPSEINPEIAEEWGQFRHVSWPLSPGGSVALIDTEDDGKEYSLDTAAIEIGLRVMAQKYPGHFSDFMRENEDAETGDVFIQCCVLGETVYG